MKLSKKEIRILVPREEVPAINPATFDPEKYVRPILIPENMIAHRTGKAIMNLEFGDALSVKISSTESDTFICLESRLPEHIFLRVFSLNRKKEIKINITQPWVQKTKVLKVEKK